MFTGEATSVKTNNAPSSFVKIRALNLLSHNFVISEILVSTAANPFARPALASGAMLKPSPDDSRISPRQANQRL